MLDHLNMLWFSLINADAGLQGWRLGIGIFAAKWLILLVPIGLAGMWLNGRPGQREAAQTIGMRRAQVLRHVVLPQAWPAVLPPMGNYLVALLKDTSIASIISAPELMLRARDLSSEYFLPMHYYLLVGGMYLVMAWPLMQGVRLLERRAARGQRGTR